MFSRLLFTAFWCCLLTGSEGLARAAESRGTDGEHLAQTVRRYFDSIASYHPGDLVARSQFEEVQSYLRLTQKKQANLLIASHGLLQRTLPEDAPLTHIFYRDSGADVLRQAAEKLGGYEALDRLSRQPKGRKLLMEAIEERDPQMILDSLTEDEPDEEAVRPASSPTPSRRLQRIYTVEQFIEAGLEGEKSRTDHKAL